MCKSINAALENVPPTLLVRFLREHHSEWADSGVDFYSVASLRASTFAVPDVLSRDMYLLQLYCGINESVVGSCAQLLFAPIDESFADNAFLHPSRFRVIPLDSKSV
ncbi:Homeobox-leucine zipper protein HOX32 [Platanthera guangdongensis]|uniref:Homeobox-leucine zipper protein HOX32 n=1 Tax=Platanthera guangdongensis TaxID=2320717 RepID=A0ABR2MCH1_9ASPA